jgi:hypothetical protein
MDKEEFNIYVEKVCRAFGAFGEIISKASQDRLRQIPEKLPDKNCISAVTDINNLKTASLLFKRVIAVHPMGMPESGMGSMGSGNGN